MDPWWIERLVLVGLLLAGAGFFSGSETALFSLSRLKREAMGIRGDPRDRRILRLLADPRRLIVTIILGNELCNVGISTVMAGLNEGWVHRLGIRSHVLSTLVTAAITVPLLVMIGDLTPKTVAIKAAERWSRLVSRPLQLAYWIVSPVRVPIHLVAQALLRPFGAPLAASRDQRIEEAEFRALVDVAAREEEVEGAERRLIHRVFEFGDRTVGEVMTRREEVFALPFEMPLRRLVAAVAASRYSRVPIYRQRRKPGQKPIEQVLGILHAKDMVGYQLGHLEGHAVQELLKPAYFVVRSTKCDRLYRDFQRTRTHIALVVDEYGQLIGLVTMEDLLEELFGEIADEKEVRT